VNLGRCSKPACPARRPLPCAGVSQTLELERPCARPDPSLGPWCARHGCHGRQACCPARRYRSRRLADVQVSWWGVPGPVWPVVPTGPGRLCIPAGDGLQAQVLRECPAAAGGFRAGQAGVAGLLPRPLGLAGYPRRQVREQVPGVPADEGWRAARTPSPLTSSLSTRGGAG
jgi:hypothetical protein